MRAFLTGASGFIGSHLVDYLLKKRWQVRALLHQSKIHREEEIEVVRGDVRDFQTLRQALEKTDVLFHLAASLGSALISEDEFYQINAHGTRNILKAAQAQNVKTIVHLSSAGVLGSVKENEIADEKYPVNPVSIYDKSKLEGEKTALRKALEGMNIVVVRPGWVYGPGDKRTFKLINSIAKKKFILVTKGKTWQTPIYIQDLLEGILLCAEKGRKGEIYHLSGGEVLRVIEMVEAIATATGNKIPPFTLPLFPVKLAAWTLEKIFSLFRKEAPLNRAKLSFFVHPKPLSIKKAERELGFAPQKKFKDGIALAVAWYRENNWL
jgi:nucleoside-diphosphate-sugar epimerase